MKKSFLTLGILGALFAINGYADNKMVAVYTCQDGCNVTNDKTNFNCLYPDGKSCGNAAVDIFVSQTAGTKIAPNAQPKPETARSATVTARAAKKQNTTSNNRKTPRPDGVAGGSGWESCPPPCFFVQTSLGNEIVSMCMEPDGKTECHNVVQGVTARAAKKTTPKPTSGKPTGPDKSQSGWVVTQCPEGCKLECSQTGQSQLCECRTKSGGQCDEYVTQSSNTVPDD